MYLLLKLVFSLWITGIFEGWLPAKVMLWYSKRIILPSTYHFVLTGSFWLKTNSKPTKNKNICEIPWLKLSGLKNNLLFFCREQWKVKDGLYFWWLFSCPSHVDGGAFIGWVGDNGLRSLVSHKSDFFLSSWVHVCCLTSAVLGSHDHSVSVCCEWSETTVLRRAVLRMFLCTLGPAARMAQGSHRSCCGGGRKGFSTRPLWC